MAKVRMGMVGGGEGAFLIPGKVISLVSRQLSRGAQPVTGIPVLASIVQGSFHIFPQFTDIRGFIQHQLMKLVGVQHFFRKGRAKENVLGSMAGRDSTPFR